METIENTLKAVCNDVAAWRRAHRGRRGPLPHELRRRAGTVARFLGEDSVAEVLGVEPRLLVRWGERYVRPDSSPGNGGEAGADAFVDVGKELAGMLAHSATAAPCGAEPWSVEVVTPSGNSVRIRGPLDGAALEAVVRAAASSR